MQKLVNLIALFSGVVSLSVVAGGAYVYVNKDAMVERAKEKITAAATEAIAGALPDMLGNTAPLGESGPVGGSSLPIQFP
jgi:hypothetical protein|tara:strand:- start:253 stop:492 length:240 start_codon:yes stop_codon:yes gene_type:complete